MLRMKNIKRPATMNNPSVQDLLFDTEQYCWWARQLHPSAVRRLEQGFEGMFRRSLLHLMPATALGKHFDDFIGRPSKELYAMAGLILIAEFRNYTVEETAHAYTYDASIQYALDVTRDQQYISPRTIDNYRALFREDELAQNVFLEVTATIVKELDLNIEKQRCDSTHVLSNMAIFSRYQLLATAVKRFLNELKKLEPETYQSLGETLRKRYKASDRRLCFGEVANPSKVTAEEKRTIISQIGEDQNHLIDRFAENETIAQLGSYQKMKRVFEEHFEIEPIKSEDGKKEPSESCDIRDSSSPGTEPKSPGTEPASTEAESSTISTKVIKTRPSSMTRDGSKTNTLQNTSDEGATYGGHKGAGYKAQVAQAHPPRDKKGKPEGPGIVTGILTESAGQFDGDGLEPMLEQQKASALLGKEMEADSHYGSDDNVCMAQEKYGVEIISPVSGAKQYPERKEEPNESPKPGSQAAEVQARKERLDQRRKEQQTVEWKKRYAPRSGIEGLFRALDLKTGFKHLRVRGLKAVEMSLCLKVTGWNISTAAKIRAKRSRKAVFYIQRLIFWFATALTEIWRASILHRPYASHTAFDNYHNIQNRKFLFCVDIGTGYNEVPCHAHFPGSP
jgi:Transposase DDE domain/Transposase domain (DUF772)